MRDVFQGRAVELYHQIANYSSLLLSDINQADESDLKSLCDLFETLFEEALIYEGLLRRFFIETIRNENEVIIKCLLNFGVTVCPRVLLAATKLAKENCLKIILSHVVKEKNISGLLCDFVTQNLTNEGDVYETLIKHGADINFQSSFDFASMIHNAIFHHNIVAIEILLSYGLDPHIKVTRKYFTKENYGSLEKQLSKEYFSLPTPTIESLIKYGALHIQHDNDENLEKFYARFTESERKSYLEYAQSCVSEVAALKKITLTSRFDFMTILKKLTLQPTDSNLFDFVTAQGSRLQQYLNDMDMVSDVFNICASTSLPVYKIPILKKFKRLDILNGFQCNSNLRSTGAKEVFLRQDCLRMIFDFLPMNDLISMWIAFYGK